MNVFDWDNIRTDRWDTVEEGPSIFDTMGPSETK